MAEATAKIEASVTLTLSLEEAAALAVVTGEVTGHFEDSPRKYTSLVYSALIYINEVANLAAKYDSLLRGEPDLHFKNFSEGIK